MHKKVIASLSLISMLLLAGCSGGDVPKSQPTTTETADAQAVIDALPTELKSQYEGVANSIESSPYSDFQKVEGPWKVCYSESYQGNPWRVALANEMKRLADQYKKEGLVASFQMSVSENDVARQNQQIRQFVSQKCSVIMVVAGSSTALNQAIGTAKNAGIPVVTIAGSVTTTDAVNVDSNYAVLGADLATSVSKVSDNVLMVKGIEGSPIAIQQNDGAKAVWSKTGTKIASEVNGNWTPSVTKEAVLNALTTSPGKIGAVWTTGSETAVISKAFMDSKRPAPLITGSISGDALGFWKENPDYFKFEGVALVPSWTAQTGFNVAMRIMDGKGPLLSTLEVPIPKVTMDDFSTMWRSCMTTDASSIFPVASKDPLPSELMDAYFKTPGKVGPFEYSQTPDPCK